MLMKLSAYLKSVGLDDAAFAELSGNAFSAEAVRKWRFGARVPRPEHLRRIADLTGGSVTANDFMASALELSHPAVIIEASA